MGRIFRIGGALVLGTVMVGGAFLSSRADSGVEDAASRVVVTEVPKLAQEVKDSDDDGVRDWEEELRGTDPFTPDDWRAVAAATAPETPASDYVPPTTLTGQFAESFFEDYVRTSGGRELSEADQSAFVNAAISSLEREATPRLYTRIDLSIGSEGGLAPIRTYGNEVGTSIVLNTTLGENALLVLRRALKENDPEMLAELNALQRSYAQITRELLAASVPPAVVSEHLDLLNIYSALAHDIAAIQDAFEDPLRALVSAKQYQSDFEALYQAFDNTRRVLEQAGIVYTNDEPGVFFFSLRP